MHSHDTNRDVKASCCHVSGNQNPGRVCLEPIQGLEALPLLHRSMQGYSGQPQQLQQSCHSPHCTDGIHEDQGAAWVLCKDVVQELIALSITALQAGLLHLDITKNSGFSRKFEFQQGLWTSVTIWISETIWISVTIWISARI
jgi:hypothetical protein